MRGGRSGLRRLAGAAWIAAWVGLLYVVAAPWRGLGGVVDEQLRWLEWFVLMAGLTTGFTVGRLGRQVALERGGVSHLRLLRRLLYPVGAVAAAGVVALWWRGASGGIGVVVTALLAYWGGIDVAYGAVPLLDGRAYAFARPLPPDTGPRRRGPRPWAPPWDGW